MAYNVNNVFQVDEFYLGLDLSSSPTALPKQALTEAKNVFLNPNRGLTKRSGVTFFSKLPIQAKIIDVFEYFTPTGARHLHVFTEDYFYIYTGTEWIQAKTGLNSANKRWSQAIHKDFAIYTNGSTQFGVYNTSLYPIGIEPPSNAPSVSEGSSGGLTGKYAYVYCYKRNTPYIHYSNPSPVSNEIIVNNKKINVQVTASPDATISKIVIYRTYDFSVTGQNPEKYYFVAEVNNANQTYVDSTPDSDLGEEVEWDNNVPPVAKYLIVYNDKVFYAKSELPQEVSGIENGDDVVFYSKRGNPHACPATNYEYFDRGDGDEITGIAALPDYLIVFKHGKLFTIRGEFLEKEAIASLHGIGCIAPYAILNYDDKIIFLAEEGWYAFDGNNLFDLSRRIRKIIADGYVNPNYPNAYDIVLYPEYKAFLFLCNLPGLERKVLVGSFVVPLIFIEKGIPEQTSENIVAWTWLSYPYHSFTCLTNITNESGLMKIIGATESGEIYLLESGSADITGSGESAVSHDIVYDIQSGWINLGTPVGIVHILRQIKLSYNTDVYGDATLTIYANFFATQYDRPVHGEDTCFCGSPYCGYTYCGLEGNLLEHIIIPAGLTGNMFRWKLHGESTQPIALHAITFYSRKRATR